MFFFHQHFLEPLFGFFYQISSISSIIKKMAEYNNLSYSHFEIIKDLGSGSFGKVQLVRKKSDQKLYAIKSVNMTRLNEKQKNSALNQVRLLASINIPYVITYKGSFFNKENQSLCVIMEYADGGDLQGKINQRFKESKGKGFQEDFIWKVAFQLFQCLKILHNKNILHRDIKSANVFFVKGVAKLGDLNVSKVIQSKNMMCKTQTGTPYYTSPQIWKAKQYDSKCDIWSTGCLIYEMCTLSPPFKASDFPGLYKKVIAGTYDPIPSFYSQDLKDLIQMCLTVDQRMRPSAIEILETPMMSRLELSLQNFGEVEQNIQLIEPIKCPKVLRFLQNKLPQSNFDDKCKKTVGFATKKQIETDGDTQSKKSYSKARSEKLIYHSKIPEKEERNELRTLSKNKIMLSPIQKHEINQPLKFSAKKVARIPNISDKKIGASSKKLILLGKQNENDNENKRYI